MSLEHDTMVQMIYGNVSQAKEMLETGDLPEARTHLTEAMEQFEQLDDIERDEAEVQPPKQLTIDIQ